MSEDKLCPECGCELPPAAPAGHCPDCLLRLGQQTEPTGNQVGRSAAQFNPPAPTELAASFPQLEILELVGQGGMGAVYRARQKSLDRTVALKVIKADLADDPGFAERFVREARSLARLNHPNIVSVHDFGEADGLFYFVMEYVDGADLRRLVESEELKPEQALRIVPQLCEALQYAHDEGIVHRDIKPENILFDSRGRVKIADFGLAKLLSDPTEDQSLTRTHQVMGTPLYMAPEQMEGSRTVDHRADIYSLGVVFYELLTGELPLGRFAAPSEKAPVDDRLDEVVLRALEKEPPRRYQHASEMKTDVERIHANRRAEPVAAVPPVAVPPPKPQPTIGIEMKQHVTILAILHIVFDGMLLLVAAIVFFVVSGAGLISMDPQAMGVTAIVGAGVGGFLALLALPGVICGFGLLKCRPWSRVLALILAVLGILNFPFGTAISVYSFWVLLHQDTIPLFSEQEAKW